MRVPRKIVPYGLHHIIQRSVKNIFFDENDNIKYLLLLRHAELKYNFSVIEYVLMSNHIHLIIRPLDSKNLSDGMKIVAGGDFSYFNKKYFTFGSLWAGRFYCKPIPPEQYEKTREYLLLNPVKVGLVSSAREYRWCSAYERELRVNANRFLRTG